MHSFSSRWFMRIQHALSPSHIRMPRDEARPQERRNCKLFLLTLDRQSVWIIYWRGEHFDGDLSRISIVFSTGWKWPWWCNNNIISHRNLLNVVSIGIRKARELLANRVAAFRALYDEDEQDVNQNSNSSQIVNSTSITINNSRNSTAANNIAPSAQGARQPRY